MTGPRALSRGEGGQATVLVAIFLMALLFAIGLAVDAGQLYVARRTTQEAADAGAFAAALVLYQGGSQAEAWAAAAADATRNGYTHGGDGGLTTVYVYLPPNSGPYATNPNFAEVVISTQVRTALVPAQAQLNSVRVRAVAGKTLASSGHALFVLSPNEGDAFRSTGSGGLNVVGGGILVNSNETDAATLSGAGSVTATYIRVVGNYVDTGTGSFSPVPLTGVTGEPDPFRSITGPSSGGLATYTNTTISTAGTYTLGPGIYNPGIVISAIGATVNFLPGIYILRGEGLQISGSSTVQLDASAGPTDGVMLFNTDEQYPTANGDCGEIKISGTGSFNLRAMGTGAYQGMLIFSDNTCDDTDDVVITGGTNTFTGTVYLPLSEVNVSGGGTYSFTGQILALELRVSASTLVTLTYDSTKTAQIALPVLAE